MNKYYIGLVLFLFIVACSGGKKKTLEPAEIENEEAIAPRDSLQVSAVVYNAVEGIEISKMLDHTMGSKANSTNLIELKLTQPEKEEKEIQLDEFYKTVSYITLKHPLANKGMGFLGNADIKVFTKHENGENVSTMGAFNSRVYLSKSNIVAGDSYLGYHVYSLTGEFLYTIASREKLPEYEQSKNTISYYTNEQGGIVTGFSLWENKALINVQEDSTFCTHIYDIERQRGLLALNKASPSLIVKENSFLSYNGNTNIKTNSIFMVISDYSQQDNSITNTFFQSSNPEATTKGRRTSPESHIFSYYNDVLTTRQAYNDTIYRVKDSHTLEAAYALNSGSMKLSNQDANAENKSGKLIINRWIETDDFMFIMASVDQDFPINRTEHKVKFRYYYYPKKEGKLYVKESASLYPEEYTLDCHIEDAIPILAYNAKQYGNKLYTSYTKGQLSEIISSDKFSNYPSSLQEKINTLYTNLPDGSLLVAILK